MKETIDHLFVAMRDTQAREWYPSPDCSDAIVQLYSELAGTFLSELDDSSKPIILIGVNQAGLAGCIGVQQKLKRGHIYNASVRHQIGGLGPSGSTVDGMTRSADLLSVSWSGEEIPVCDNATLCIFDLALSSGNSVSATLRSLREHHGAINLKDVHVLSIEASPFAINRFGQVPEEDRIGSISCAYLGSGVDRHGYIVAAHTDGYRGVIGEVEKWVDANYLKQLQMSSRQVQLGVTQ